MKKLGWGLTASVCTIVAALAAGSAAAAGGGKDSRKDVGDVMRAARAQTHALGLPKLKTGGPTKEEVGDVDSFGRNVTYLGVAQTMPVDLRTDCTPQPGEDPSTFRCITMAPAPASTVYNERDLASITLPAKATHSLVCFAVTPLATYAFFNGQATAQSARFSLTAGVTIHSDVLNDPAAIDPSTGLSYGGVIETGLGLTLDAQTLQPGDSQVHREISSRNCIAGIISKQALSETYGLPDTLVDQFFKKPITFSFHSTGSVRSVDDADIFYGVRLYGD